ncbi:CdaR family protein [Lutibacter citreus]|uniref:CdaR family protein n=1 Tax=Lutibacter citreus TaxID=2138210 RepID=UPI000DBE87E6|nr:YbbR-like domain-containing protein [Lutibacter citreus]
MKTTIKTSGLTLINNRKIKVFVFFLILTSIMWVLIELSKTYTSSAIFKAEYENLPADKLIQVAPVSKIDIAIKGPGFDLLKYKLRSQKINFRLNNLAKKGNSYYFLPNLQLSRINAKIIGETELLRISNDTIFVEIGNNISKKVPVISKGEIKFKLGYNFLEKLKIQPDSITISGPQKYIDSIKEVSTSFFKLNDVYESIEREIILKNPQKNKNIKFSNTKVKIFGIVDKFTEGKIKIPVQIINEPKNIKVNPFPKEIEIIYQAGLSNFNDINENSFSIVFDYNQYLKDTTTQFLTPIIKQKSKFVSTLKLNPNKIEFLLQK